MKRAIQVVEAEASSCATAAVALNNTATITADMTQRVASTPLFIVIYGQEMCRLIVERIGPNMLLLQTNVTEACVASGRAKAGTGLARNMCMPLQSAY